MKIDILPPDLALQEEGKSLFLEPHPKYASHFLVNSFDPTYIHYLKDLIGPYTAVSIFDLPKLYTLAEEQGYNKVIYLTDPTPTVERLAHLEDEYPYPLETDLYKFQLQGFNWLKDRHGVIVNWSTGTGKSVFAVALAQYYLREGKIDKVLIACRRRNRTNWARQFERIAKLSATVVEAPGKTAELKRIGRAGMYQDSQIFIINYEKMRFKSDAELDREHMHEALRMAGEDVDDDDYKASGDGEEIFAALKGKRVLFIWDEMPIFLKNMSSYNYKGAAKLAGKKCVKDRYQAMLSATPIENIPLDIYGCVS